jgi:hypothetical protein
VGDGKCTQGLVICVLYSDTANSSDCLMSNVWLVGDGLMGEGNIMAVLFHLATDRKVAGSIPDGVIGNFYSFGRTMTLDSTQTITEMSTRNIS